MAELQVRNVGVRFGGLVALDDVSFDVASNTVVGIIGPNGAGKTTVFNVICGFVKPTSGELRFDDQRLRPRPEKLTRHGIARTLQGVGLFAGLTVLENVMVGAAPTRRAGFASPLFGLPFSDGDERRLAAAAMRWLTEFGIAETADRLPTQLPYPVQKRVALARALVSEPRLLLLDEPAGGLGADDITELGTLIKSLPHRENPTSVLLVEHHMDVVMDVCDQVVVFDFGKVVATGTPEQVQSNPAVADAYLGTAVPDAPDAADFDTTTLQDAT